MIAQISTTHTEYPWYLNIKAVPPIGWTIYVNISENLKLRIRDCHQCLTTAANRQLPLELNKLKIYNKILSTNLFLILLNSYIENSNLLRNETRFQEIMGTWIKPWLLSISINIINNMTIHWVKNLNIFNPKWV